MTVKRMVAGLAGIASAMALGLGSVAPAAHASSGSYSVSWKLSYAGPRRGSVQSITAPGRNDAWAIATNHYYSFFLLHWNGRGWHKSAMPVRGYYAFGVVSSSADNVWIFGFVEKTGVAEALQWDGHRWTREPEPDIGRDTLSSETVVSPTDAFIGLDDSVDGPPATVYHWNGTIWKLTRLPAGFTFGQLSSSSRGNIWAVGVSDAGYQVPGPVTAYRWRDGAWQAVRRPHRYSYTAAVLAQSARNVWVTDPDVVLHWNGTRWSHLSSVGAGPGPLAAYGRHGLWVGANSLWTGSAWLTVGPGIVRGYPVFANALASVPGTDQTWLAGDSRVGAVIMRAIRGPS
jgi:hypothetical protein